MNIWWTNVFWRCNPHILVDHLVFYIINISRNTITSSDILVEGVHNPIKFSDPAPQKKNSEYTIYIADSFVSSQSNYIVYIFWSRNTYQLYLRSYCENTIAQNILDQRRTNGTFDVVWNESRYVSHILLTTSCQQPKL